MNKRMIMVINFILIEKRLQIGVEVVTGPIYIYIYMLTPKREW